MNAPAPASHSHDRPVLALSGGIGGAKLALGLSRILPPGELVVVANTGDDFEHLGLSISPDLDTLMYTLAGIDHPETGWGLRSETWTFMAALGALGGETWFRLGDGDLATHVERTRRLEAGETLSRITDDFCRRLGVRTKILPMSDDKVRTRVRTEAGWLEFQDYFVRRRCEPAVAGGGSPSPGVHGGARRRALARGGDLPVQSVPEHRSDPGVARRARGTGRLSGAGRGGVADRRRPRRQRTYRQDDDGARVAGDGGRGCAALR